MKEHRYRLLFYNVNGGRRLPLQDVFLAAKSLHPLVGIGGDQIQANFLSACLNLRSNPYKGLPFLANFLWEINSIYISSIDGVK